MQCLRISIVYFAEWSNLLYTTVFDGFYMCCPYEDAVCCLNRIHCCPKGFVCDIETGSCDPKIIGEMGQINMLE
ncbi:unnamed protein product [Larinioides sclopetarius]|uniref:Granulins domain-containing protein n=1 Tax=Larinioides sclopetarius TaxID=280406 RepID=A0AAV2B417_9ARAC